MIRKCLVLLEVLVILGALAVGAGAWRMKAALDQPLQVEQEKLLLVPAGSTPTKVFYRMQADGQIDGAFWLRLYWRFNLAGESLHVGEYRMQPGMSARDLIGAWQRGDVVQYNLTLVEGWSFRQVRAALARQDKLLHQTDGLSDAQIMEKIGHPGIFPEGRFFPDTYRYVSGTSDVELLQQAYARLDEVLAQEWAQRAPDAPYGEPYKALIMASLVEKETGVPNERGRIAGVFVKRLSLGMMLQTDPTVIYGMGERYNGKLTRADLREPTPYNTYTMTGLPPTPIAMVGREAIHAALNPSVGESLYFVAKGDGSHIFSSDLESHNAAVREYQLNRRSDYRSSPAPQDGGSAGSGAQPEAPQDDAPAATPESDAPAAQ